MREVYIAKDYKKGQEAPRTTEENNTKKAPGHSPVSWAAYHYKPGKVWFETQEKEEKVILLLRRHPITNWHWILIAIALAIAPVFLSQSPILSFLPPNFEFMAILLWYLVVIAFVLEGALSWFFNVYIVTDERLVDVDFNNLLYREIKDAKIDKIQEVKNTIGGVLGIVFNYGSVNIQTAGALPTFEFEDIPNPAEVARIIQELRTEEEVEVIEGRVR